MPESRYYTFGRTSAMSVGSRLMQSRVMSCSNPDIAGTPTATDEEVKHIMSSKVREEESVRVAKSGMRILILRVGLIPANKFFMYHQEVLTSLYQPDDQHVVPEISQTLS